MKKEAEFTTYFAVTASAPALRRTDPARETGQCAETALTFSSQHTNASGAQATIGGTDHPQQRGLRRHFRREWPLAARSAP